METITELWPFAPGQQEHIFKITSFAIFGLILLNVISNIRQKSPVSKIISGLFSYVTNKNKTEIIIGKALYIILILSFFIAIIDISINGNQIVNIGM